MNNIIIKVNNKEEYNKTLDILSDLGIVWNNGMTIDSKNDEANSYDFLISMMTESFSVFEEEEDIKEDEPVVCLIVEHNKLFWELLDNLIKNCFDDKDYEMYAFKEFEKTYNL